MLKVLKPRSLEALNFLNLKIKWNEKEARRKNNNLKKKNKKGKKGRGEKEKKKEREEKYKNPTFLKLPIQGINPSPLAIVRTPPLRAINPSPLAIVRTPPLRASCHCQDLALNLWRSGNLRISPNPSLLLRLVVIPSCDG
jgi:hypothetical protein